MEKFISASILSANLLDLKNEVERVGQSGAKMIHFDVMDGCFVDNISFGFPVLEAVKKCTSLPLDVHLMIAAPLKYVKRFADAGAQIITFHLESENDPKKVIAKIKESGAKAGLALNPSTPIEKALPYMDMIDLLLIMTVEPGFGGQSYIREMNEKISDAKKYITENGFNVTVQVDGGINETTAAEAVSAGADCLAAGNYLFTAASMKDAAARIASYF